MRILYNCFEYPPCRHGGIGSFYKDLAESLVRQGHQVTIVGIYYDNVLKLDKIQQEVINGVKVIRIPQFRKTGNARIDTLLSRVHFRHYLRQLIMKEKFDFIEFPENPGWLPWGAPCNTPLITRLHGGQVFFEKTLNRQSSGLFKLFERMQIKRSKYVVAVSNYVANTTNELYQSRKSVHVIYNGIRIPSIDGFSKSHSDNNGIKNILFYGSVDPKKGVKELIQSYILLINRGYELKLYIAGKNGNKQYNDELNKIIPYNLRDSIVFYGPLERETELFPLIAQCDICCFPSKVESFGIAPVEAMAWGKPVVFTKLAAGPEVIRDGVDGLLCDPYNPEDIANKIAMFLDDVHLCERCSQSAYNRAWTDFTIEKMMDNNLKFYQSCLDER